MAEMMRMDDLSVIGWVLLMKWKFLRKKFLLASLDFSQLCLALLAFFHHNKLPLRFPDLFKVVDQNN